MEDPTGETVRQMRLRVYLYPIDAYRGRADEAVSLRLLLGFDAHHLYLRLHAFHLYGFPNQLHRPFVRGAVGKVK